MDLSPQHEANPLNLNASHPWHHDFLDQSSFLKGIASSEINLIATDHLIVNEAIQTMAEPLELPRVPGQDQITGTNAALKSASKATTLGDGITIDSLAIDGNSDQFSKRSKPTSFTKEANKEQTKDFNWEDTSDFNDASQGLLSEGMAAPVIRDENGKIVWNMRKYVRKLNSEEAPDSVNPSLWRQQKLNSEYGVFEVTTDPDRQIGIYQVRGFDLANMSLIKAPGGWIVVDPLTTEETATAALEAAEKYITKESAGIRFKAKRIKAVIFTHSHVDHFGGAGAILKKLSPRRQEKLQVFAPDGFLEEATSENVIAGTAMGRRAIYMYGKSLTIDEQGHVDAGLGKGVATGTIGILSPTDIIDKNTDIDSPEKVAGLEIVFQYTPDSEAPAEMTFFFPELNAWCAAEIASQTMHNILTLRGAKVRDALGWSKYLNDALYIFDPEQKESPINVVFQSHHWPTWAESEDDNSNVINYIASERDKNKFIHDQSVRMLNNGHTSIEIANELELPDSLVSTWSSHDYYGTLSHNSKAVYQRYIGWFDGVPANLNPLPPAEESTKYIDAMGGQNKVLRNAKASYRKGEYRWTATLLNHAVFADPDNKSARKLLAKAYDQLGYQAESGPWRDFYLTGAMELRQWPETTGSESENAIDLVSLMPKYNFFDAIATRVIPGEVPNGLSFNFIFTEDSSESNSNEYFHLSLSNDVLNYRALEINSEKDLPEADLTITSSWQFAVDLIVDPRAALDILDEFQMEGQPKDKRSFRKFFRKLDQTTPDFAIVNP